MAQLFHGDFFPDKMHDVIEKGKKEGDKGGGGGGGGAGTSSGTSKAAGGGKVPKNAKQPKLARRETLAIADQMKREVSGAEYAFLVAKLAAPQPRRRISWRSTRH